MKKTVFITDYISSPDIEFDILENYLSNKISEEIQYILVWHEEIDKKFIDSLPNLKGIVRYGVGYENIDLNYCSKKNIMVCNNPDYGTDEVSDTALAMILNISRGITRYDYFSRSYFDTWQENTIKSLKRTNKSRVGIIGAGRIGGSLILKLNAIGFNTCFYDPYKERGYEKLLKSERYDNLNDLLNKCDIISLNCPQNEETQGIVNEEFIKQMKKGSSLVNTARGGLIYDIDYFLEPLRSNHISNLYLDVLPNEPPINSKLISEWRNRSEWLEGRLVINPHSAYFSKTSFQEMRSKAAKNVLRMIKGLKPFNKII
tara:strand:+ start:6079 stop:7026 length:948 start_codon:yes stop_codon:yes gene_type:complete